MANRRKFLKTTGVVGTVGLAGCIGGSDSSDQDTTTEADDGGDDTTEADDGSDTTEGDGGDDTTEADSETTTEQQLNFGNGEVDFNVSPSVAQESLQEQYQPIQEHLEDTIGLPASMQLANNYSAVIQALGSGTSDVAETGPFAAALGVKADMAEIALQRKGYGTWEYQSLIVAADEVDVSDLDELATYVENNETTIAFADRLSASGALMPLYNLKEEAGVEIGGLPEGGGGNAAFEANFSNHVGAFETLAAGQAEFAGFGGFVPGTVDNFEDNASVVYEHTGLPRAPIVVSPELSQAEKDAVIEAFLDAPDEIYWGEDGEEGTDDDLWFNGVREVSVDEYQPVIDAANALGVGADYFE